jgi:hypothetical protein
MAKEALATLTLFWCAAVGISCGGSPAAPAQTLAVTTVASFDLDGGAFAGETTLAIRDQPTWQNLWSQLNTGRVPLLPLPSIDFTTEMIVVAAMGVKPTAGYQVSIASATEQAGSVSVTVVETTPGLCAVAQGLTAPVVVAKLPLRRGPVTFSVTQQVRNCGS